MPLKKRIRTVYPEIVSTFQSKKSMAGYFDNGTVAREELDKRLVEFKEKMISDMIDTMRSEMKKEMNEMFKFLEEKVKEVITQELYSPGGIGAEIARKHFDSHKDSLDYD